MLLQWHPIAVEENFFFVDEYGCGIFLKICLYLWQKRSTVKLSYGQGEKGG